MEKPEANIGYIRPCLKKAPPPKKEGGARQEGWTQMWGFISTYETNEMFCLYLGSLRQ